jgi:mRNA interferase RelE/StbE
VIARYEAQIARRAVKAIGTLPRREQQRVRAAIELLADNPRPPGCVALAGEERAYRVRVGDYRIGYEVLDQQLVIQVVRVAHRREVYRQL